MYCLLAATKGIAFITPLSVRVAGWLWC